MNNRKTALQTTNTLLGEQLPHVSLPHTKLLVMTAVM